MQQKLEQKSKSKFQQWMTKKDVENYLQVSRWTIQLWVRKGILPCYKLPGGTKKSPVRFKKEDIDNLLTKYL